QVPGDDRERARRAAPGQVDGRGEPPPSGTGFGNGRGSRPPGLWPDGSVVGCECKRACQSNTLGRHRQAPPAPGGGRGRGAWSVLAIAVAAAVRPAENVCGVRARVTATPPRQPLPAPGGPEPGGVSV